jgi:hypothetical protein
VSYNKELQSEGTVDAVLGRFYQTFNHYGVRRAIGGLTKFYDLYLEVISGDGEYQSLESNLYETVEAPAGASEVIDWPSRPFWLIGWRSSNCSSTEVFSTASHSTTSGPSTIRGSTDSEGASTHITSNRCSRGSRHSPRQRGDNLPDSFRDVPFLAGGLFEPILSDERDYDVSDTVMKPVLSRFVESEERTLVNEAANGSLLQTYTEGFESRDLAGQVPRHYSAIVDAYEAELEYVESEIERTLRSFTGPEAN